MIKALVVSNGIGGAAYYKSSDEIRYDLVEVTRDFDPDLTPYDLLVVPNGCDHVAMLKIRGQVRAFLDAGNAVLCCDGWFTNWVPGNRWIHDNSKATKDVRHFAKTDRHDLLKGVDLNKFDFEPHGMSGWWACGYIAAAPGADVLIEDTWQRAIVVLDETTTAGAIFLTASGPLGDFSFYGDADGISQLFKNVLHFLITRKTASTQELQPA